MRQILIISIILINLNVCSKGLRLNALMDDLNLDFKKVFDSLHLKTGSQSCSL